MEASIFAWALSMLVMVGFSPLSEHSKFGTGMTLDVPQ
jgi:hypothetical protein